MTRLWLYLAIFVCVTAAGAPRAAAAAAEEIVPRTIIALYNGGDIQNSYIHLVVEMPLNHLGLTVEYHDIHEPLPDIAQRADVRGVITWFYGNTLIDADNYLKWALAALDAGKKYAMIGSLGISEAQRNSSSALVDRFLKKLGIKMLNRWIDRPFDVAYDYKTPDMFLTPAPYEWIRPAYLVVHVGDDRVQTHLAAHRPGTPDDDSALVVTGPNGGYIANDYAIRTNERDGDEVIQWLVDPFQFFRLAYGTDDLPKPDVTTIAGRRIFYSNIDGDGWNNITQIEEYRGKKTLSAQVIFDKVLKPFPDMPVMVAPIAGDIDPDWVGTEESRRVAREIWALPYIEAGTHTYSHPFYWQFFENGDARQELPYLHLYTTPTWKPEDNVPQEKSQTVALPFGYIVPRAFANEPFDIHKEIEGSLKELEPLLPKGKTIDILAWSGNCSPWEEVVRLTRAAKLQNINGGDSRFDPDYPAYASLAPIGRQVGKERQIYNSTSNENTYTDLWSKNFHAFGYLKNTLANSETPVRLTPMSIYYHMYSGERPASLNALISDVNYARAQDIAPITVGHYTHVAEGFYDTQIVATAPNTWRIDNRGALETIRFDHSSLKAVDFVKSRGVIGERYLQGSLYVYLDADAAQPVIAIKDNAAYYMQPQETTAYLIESRWTISNLGRNRNRLDFTAQGFGAGEMVWHMPAAGSYRVHVNGKTEKVEVTADHLLKFRLEEDAIQPLHIMIAESSNA